MNARKKWRFRFGLRSLLSAVAVCAVGLAIYGTIPEPELLPGIRYGDPQSDLLQKLGQPEKKTHNRNGTENWIYLQSVTVHDSSGKRITLNSQPWQDWSWPKYGYEEWLVLTFQDGHVVSAVVVDTWKGQIHPDTTLMYPDLQL